MQSSRVCCSVGSLAELCLRKLLFAGSRLPCRLLSRPGSERRDPSTAGIEDGISCSCCGPGDQKCRLLNSKTCPVQLHWSCQNQNHPCIFHHVLNTLPRQAIIARDIHSPDHQNRQGGHHNLQKVSEIRDACKNMIYIYIIYIYYIYIYIIGVYKAASPHASCHRFSGPAGDPAVSLRGIQTATGPEILRSISHRAACTAFSARSSGKRISTQLVQHRADGPGSWLH